MMFNADEIITFRFEKENGNDKYIELTYGEALEFKKLLVQLFSGDEYFVINEHLIPCSVFENKKE